MPISRPTIEAVREQTDIVQVISHRVRLRRGGRNLLGLCPFHNEKTPSFNVRPDKQTYHCFGCNEGGDVFAFLMAMDGLSFVEAITECAQVAGVTIEEEKLSQEEVQQRARKASLFDVCKASAALMQLAAPEADLRCPMLDFTEPIRMGPRSPRRPSPITSVRLSTSTLSPTTVEVP